MPTNPQRHLSMVCNMTPLTIRTMGLMVNHEHGLSSRSLFTHVCAICGRLLYSRSDNSHLPREIGAAGPACQLRGRMTDFLALPPFLLLWSKEALGRHLRSCLMYNNDKKSLTLRKGWESAPWLHFKKHLMVYMAPDGFSPCFCFIPLSFKIDSNMYSNIYSNIYV